MHSEGDRDAAAAFRLVRRLAVLRRHINLVQLGLRQPPAARPDTPTPGAAPTSPKRAGRTVSTNYSAAGTYRGSVTVTDSNGQTASANRTPVVVTAPPPPSLEVSCGVSPLSGDTSTTFNWTATASGGTPGYTYAWSGTHLTGKSGSIVSTNYSAAGTYPGSVTVTDSAGQAKAASCTPVVVTTPPPQNGCIQVLKEAFDPSNNELSPVPQFSFTLDGGVTIQNDANGNAEFTNVPLGSHTVTETDAGSTWTLLSATPAGGHVIVTAPGPVCAAVAFKNKKSCRRRRMAASPSIRLPLIRAVRLSRLSRNSPSRSMAALPPYKATRAAMPRLPA